MKRVSQVALVAVPIGLASLAGYLAGEHGWIEKLAAIHPRLVWVVPALFLLLAMAAGTGAYVARRNVVDWRRVREEQRLWESGPVGRRWLRRPKRAHRRRWW